MKRGNAERRGQGAARIHRAIEALERRIMLSVTLFPGPEFSVFGGAHSVAFGDVNGDGKPDLVTGGTDAPILSVLLGNGDGTFQAQRTFWSGTNPYGVAIADVNGDGKPDLVGANYGAGTVGVLLGNGDGTFQGVQALTVGSHPYAVAVADVNGDGKVDLVAANYGAGTLSVLLGNGNGSFQSQRTVAVGSSPQSVAIADVNADGKADLVAANYGAGTLSILLGNGDGSFQSQQTVAVGSNATVLATNGNTLVGGKDYVLKLDVSGSTLTAWIDDGTGLRQLTQVTDSTFASGKPGVRVWNSTARFDEFNVTNGTATAVATGAASASSGTPYTLRLWSSNAASTTGWRVDWGDGTVNVYSGNPSSVSHTYAPTVYASQSDSITATATVGGAACQAGTTSVNVLTAPDAPSGLQVANVSPTQIALTWVANDERVSSYSIEQSTDNGLSFTGIATPSVGARSYTAAGLTAGSTYVFRIRAVGLGGTSAYATSASIVAQNPTVVAPTISGAASVGEGAQYTLTLNGPADPAHGAVSFWTVNWGDGTIDTPITPEAGSTVTAAAHVYVDGPAAYNPTAVATYADSTTSQSLQVSGDSSVGSGGTIVTSYTSEIGLLSNGVAVQSDGKILVAGRSTANGSDYSLSRYNPDGTFDRTFGSSGVVAIAQPNNDQRVIRVAVQGDGKILVSGLASSDSHFALARFNADGSVDTSFGTGGTLVTDLNNHDSCSGFVVQSGGWILVAAANGPVGPTTGRIAIERFNMNGVLDTTFGAAGKVQTQFVSYFPFDATIQGDGSVLAAGWFYDPTPVTGGEFFHLQRFTTSGALDTSFGNSGDVSTGFGTTTDQANTVILDPSYGILAAGEFDAAPWDHNDALSLLHYTVDGKSPTRTDSTIKSGGAGLGWPTNVAIQRDASGNVVGILVAGEQPNASGSGPSAGNYQVARFRADGSGLDTTFGTNGVLTTNFFGGNGIQDALIVTPDGGFLLAGRVTDSSGMHFAIRRFQANGGVSVINLPPVIDSSGNQGLSVGADGCVLLQFRDNGVSDTHTATIDWADSNDGQPDVTQAQVYESQGSGMIWASHTYSQAGTYSTTVTLRDNGNAQVTQAFTVTVGPAIPGNLAVIGSTGSTVDLGWTGDAPVYKIYRSQDGDAPVLLGTSTTLWYHDDSDLEPDSGYSYAVVADYGDGVMSAPAHVFAATATVSLAADASDAVVTVVNPDSPTEGGYATIKAVTNDVAALSGSQVMVNWGDGSISTIGDNSDGFGSYDTGVQDTRGISAQHLYARGGDYFALMIVTDSAGRSSNTVFSVTEVGHAPEITSPASAVMSPIGRSAVLDVSAASATGDDLVYSWSVISTPSNAAVPRIDNNSGYSSSTAVTFYQAGEYQFEVTVADAHGGLSVTSDVSITVDQLATSVWAGPASVISVAPGGTYHLQAAVLDQFGYAMISQPSPLWSITTSRGGLVDATSGVYTAPIGADGIDVVTVSFPAIGTSAGHATIDVQTSGVIPQYTGAAPDGVGDAQAIATVDSSDVLLTWDPVGNSADGVLVEASNDNWDTHVLLGVAAGADRSYLATGLVQNAAYEFRLIAYNGAGTSAPIDIGPVTTGMAPSDPGFASPSEGAENNALTAVPLATLKVLKNLVLMPAAAPSTYQQFSCSWFAPTEFSGHKVTYKVIRSDSTMTDPAKQYNDISTAVTQGEAWRQNKKYGYFYDSTPTANADNQYGVKVVVDGVLQKTYDWAISPKLHEAPLSVPPPTLTVTATIGQQDVWGTPTKDTVNGNSIVVNVMYTTPITVSWSDTSATQYDIYRHTGTSSTAWDPVPVARNISRGSWSDTTPIPGALNYYAVVPAGSSPTASSGATETPVRAPRLITFIWGADSSVGLDYNHKVGGADNGNDYRGAITGNPSGTSSQYDVREYIWGYLANNTVAGTSSNLTIAHLVDMLPRTGPIALVAGSLGGTAAELVTKELASRNRDTGYLAMIDPVAYPPVGGNFNISPRVQKANDWYSGGTTQDPYPTGQINVPSDKTLAWINTPEGTYHQSQFYLQDVQTTMRNNIDGLAWDA